ncbi:MAG: ammonia channel protein, partial [Pseudomonadota bacterium]
GTLLTPVFGHSALGGVGLDAGMVAQLGVQATGIVTTILFAGVGSFVLAVIINRVIPLDVDEERETQGLDQYDHGQKAYTNLY